MLILICGLLTNCSSNIESGLKNKVIYNSDLKDSFFLIDKWSYPSFTVKDEDGNFHFAVEGEKDTTHLYHTSKIGLSYDSLSAVNLDNEAGLIRYGKAFYAKDTLVIEFSESTPSAYGYLEIRVRDGSFTSSYTGGYPWVHHYEFDRQTLIFQKRIVNTGDTLRGYLNFRTNKPRYLNLQGYFKVPVLMKK